MTVRRRLYELLESIRDRDPAARIVSVLISFLILGNVVAVVAETHFEPNDARMRYFEIFEFVSILIFSLEYLLRLWTAVEDERYRHFFWGRLRYAVTFLAIVDLLAIAPFFLPFTNVLELRATRVLRLLRLLRIFKLGRYSYSMQLIGRVLRNKGRDLASALFILVVLLILASSLMYFAEHDAQPEAFGSISAAMWWGASALSTVGYGDVIPVTTPGKIIAGALAILGIGLFALPAGILASGYVEEVQAIRGKPTCPHCGKPL